jgi:hypothetical protein
MKRARDQLDAFLVRPLRMRRTTARAEIHSPLHSPGILIPVVMRDCGGFDAVSKTVVRASVPRVRIPPPPLHWLGRAKFAAGGAVDARRNISRRGSGVNERQLASTTGSASEISFPAFPRWPGRDANGWSRSCTASSSRHSGRWWSTSASSPQCGAQASECRVPAEAAAKLSRRRLLHLVSMKEGFVSSSGR